MRIATWNINGLRARLDFLKHWLEARQPDLVGLQELKLEDHKFPHDDLAELGYTAVSHGQKSWNGVAILCRGEQPVHVERGLVGQEAAGSRLICANLEGRFGLDFCTVYCPNGKHTGHPDFADKLAWYDDLIRFSQGRNRAMVLCGDFNLCPGPLDSWSEDLMSGGIFHTVEERERFVRLLETGLVDLYRASEPEGRQFSWWDYRAGAFHKNQGLRIDFVLGSLEVQQRVARVWTDREYRKKKDGLVASDHAPVIADLRD